jgi:succinyl-CoA synthetase alpha subunit
VAILLDDRTRVCVAGITGSWARNDLALNLAYGTNVVCGTAPGRGGTDVEGVPVFSTAGEAAAAAPFDAVVAYLPPAVYLGAMSEILEAEPNWVLVITEGVPLHDSVRVLNQAAERGVRIIGPSTSGMVSAGRAKVGFLGHPPGTMTPGRVGILSRSGGFTTELARRVEAAGFGVSTAIPIGGDAVVGSSFLDFLLLFEEDQDTEAVVMYTEAGPELERTAAEAVADGRVTKPVVALVRGDALTQYQAGTTFGHAGTFLGDGATAAEKRTLLTGAGLHVVETTAAIGTTLAVLLGHGGYQGTGDST